MTPRTRSRRVAMCLLVLASSAALASCSSPAPGPSRPVALDGWKLTLPVAGDSGNAANVDPARYSPPWLTEEPGGGLTFWAPVAGATTANSEHPRTELIALDAFPAGKQAHALTASLSVARVPADGEDVIIGQVHGADDIKSVAFVMLHYRSGTLDVVVKQKQSGSAADRYPLLSDVPLGARFDIGIRDNGNGTYTFTASHDGQQASAEAPLPPAFDGATVRFQAGAYQQSDAGSSSPEDGARVTFYSLTTTS